MLSRITYDVSAVIAGLLLIRLQPAPRRLLPAATVVILGALLTGFAGSFQ